MSDRTVADLSSDEIREAILKVLAGSKGGFSTVVLADRVAREAGAFIPQPQSRYDQRPRKMDQRVQRIATEMARKGVLVKVAEGDVMPNGHTRLSRHPLYMTTEQFAAEEAHISKLRQEAAARRNARVTMDEFAAKVVSALTYGGANRVGAVREVSFSQTVGLPQVPGTKLIVGLANGQVFLMELAEIKEST